ncbi:MFS transporter [Pseudoruegeria sp. SK021]|uniref:MFS transporter n=1 Tax=Pseudoruegeria sp. SK021 TaxID=1933035 RepID=UPI000A239C22|nr:MFS transporter [Pseudoruegeria sp. SK021]OSP55351.1 MFS transporter [Pseudoruegeria sp. SK021]
MKLPSIAFLRDNARWLAAGALLMFSSSYGQTFFISTFAGEIRAEFGLSHGEWGSIYGAGTLISATIMVWAGILTDHFRVRVLGSCVLAMLALASLAMSQVSAAWALIPVILALRLAGQGMSSHIAATAMGRYFVATRGRALSTVALGVSLGEASLPLIFAALLTVFAWRDLWVVAALMALLSIPALLALLREERTPQSAAQQSQSPGLNGRHWTRPQVLRSKLFWCIIPLILGPPAFGTALFFQQVHLAEVKGWPHVQFVALFPLFTAVAVASMITTGIVLDRLGTHRLMPFYQLPMAVGFLILGGSDSLIVAAMGMALIGISNGANNTLSTAFWAETYGTRHLGANRSMATAIMVLGTAIGPFLTGALIDAGIPFDRQMPAIAVYFLLSSGLVWVGFKALRRAPCPTA